MFSWQWCLKMKLPQARWMVFIMENPWMIWGYPHDYVESSMYFPKSASLFYGGYIQSCFCRCPNARRESLAMRGKRLIAGGV